MIKLSEAYGIMSHETFARRMVKEAIPLQDAAGRVTAEDISSPIDLPPFSKSAMDGYAIPEGDSFDEYIVDATLPAGESYGKPIESGHCIKIMTGAPVPPKTARVVPWEDTDCGEERVHILHRSNKTNIAKRGEDLRQGEILCPAATLLTPLALANLAIAGVDKVPVRMVPKVAVFSTGDELLPTGATIEPGKIYDSNGPMLIALLRDLRFPVTHTGHLPDSLEDSILGLRKGLAEADAVLLTGAVSKGEFDFLPEAFKQCGLMTHFDALSVKPGKPTTFATVGNKVVFGLPGNPVSSFLMFHLFVVPGLYMMQGYIAYPRPILRELGREFKAKKGDRVRFLPGKLDSEGRVMPLEYHGSGHLLSLADADGFFEVDGESTHLPVGERVPFWPVMMKGYQKVI